MEYDHHFKAGQKSRFTIGFLDEDSYDEYHTFMTAGVFEAARKFGMNVIRFGHFGAWSNIYKNDSYVNAALDHIRQYDLDGLIFLGWSRIVTFITPEEFKKRFASIPLLCLGSKYEGIPGVYFLGATYIRKILLHLIRVHGLKKIAFIAPFWPDRRCDVYVATMKKYGIYDPNLYVAETDLANSFELPARGRKAVSILLDERKVSFNAIVSLFNYETEAIIDELKSRGFKVPGDIAVTSYEDGEIGKFASPAFTTVYFPWKEMGFSGCEKMYEYLTTGQIPMLNTVPGKVILRDSCGCISQAVAHANAGNIKPAEKSLHELTSSSLQELSEAWGQKVNGALLDLDILMKAFRNDYQCPNGGTFLSELEFQLRKITDPLLFSDIEDIISVFRKLLLPFILHEPQTFSWAENLFQQAQVLVQEKKEIIWANEEVQSKSVHATIQEIGQILVTHFSIPDIMDSLAVNLPRVNIPGCNIFLFRNKGTHENLFDEYGLAFKYHGGLCHKLNDNDRDSAKPQLPQILFPENKPYMMMTQLLHVTEDFIGFVIFEAGPVDERIYRILSLNISTALSAAISLEKLNHSYRKQVEQAHRKGMMAIVNGILHNISNVLNSISVSTHLIRDLIYTSPLDDFAKANQLLESNWANLDHFIGNDPKGKKLLQFYTKLGEPFRELQAQLLENINRLKDKIRLINDIIITQEGYIGIKSSLEEVDICALVEDVMKINITSLEKRHIKINKYYQEIPKVKVQKTKLFYVLVNLIKNAQEAMDEVPETDRELTLTVSQTGKYKTIRVTDTGTGIPQELLQSVFAYGFTTKKSGHGFGLHSCANYMTEMDGKIWAESGGPGKGTTFVLQFK
jgi:signal transduction histidine kinase/DNA-binding LacI/PurR family transcriptional regulator